VTVGRWRYAYCRKCSRFSGRRRLVAQPGGLTLGFATHLVLALSYSRGLLMVIKRTRYVTLRHVTLDGSRCVSGPVWYDVEMLVVVSSYHVSSSSYSRPQSIEPASLPAVDGRPDSRLGGPITFSPTPQRQRIPVTGKS